MPATGPCLILPTTGTIIFNSLRSQLGKINYLYALLLERILKDERQELQERKLVGTVTSP
jgi:hypothetical protein